ncbi:hypothetical protein [Mesorhizobium sp.]|uniref:hypothetical protein n=1 Tax=Mesorhizobium sp. TaxID=1871066 RepID=UPI00257D91E8|nr:hypothetical protein [Mesorhizobium sp.]
MLPHVESLDVAASVDKLLAERGSALLSMKALIAAVREQTGTERSDADLAGLITKKAALLGVTVLSDLGGPLRPSRLRPTRLWPTRSGPKAPRRRSKIQLEVVAHRFEPRRQQ